MSFVCSGVVIWMVSPSETLVMLPVTVRISSDAEAKVNVDNSNAANVMSGIRIMGCLGWWEMFNRMNLSFPR